MICWKKVKDRFGDDLLIAFEQGNFQSPIMILNKFDIEKLNKEMEEKQ